MSALAFYPDASPETTTVDGLAWDTTSTATWTTLLDATGDLADDSSGSASLRMFAYWADGANYRQLGRSILLFDTASITDGDTIDSAKLSVYVIDKTDPATKTPNSDVYTATPASNTAIATTDYAQTGGTSQTGSPVTYASMTASAFSDFTFNATGIGNISKTGVSKFCVKNANYDVARTAPGTTSADAYARANSADTAGSDTDPRLTVMSGADTVDSYYPDPSPETTTVDGSVARRSANQVWASIIAGAGTNQYDGTAQWLLAVYTASTTSNQWDDLFRSIMLFDTTAIGSDTVNAGTISIFGYSKGDTTSSTPDGQIYGATPATNTALAIADYGQTGSTAYSDAVVSYANFSTTNYNNWTLNASGRSAITAGVSKFSFKSAKHDVANSSPTWGSGIQSGLYGETAEATGTTKDPVLVVSHSAGGATIRIINLSLLGVG